MSGVYYNEIEPYCVEWLKNLVRAGLIPDGDVDSRSIVDVQPEDLHGYDQWHFFCGIGGWPLALRLAGWADDREIVTGSCPCQPFSVAGKQAGTDDARHLWPHYFRLVNAIRPNVAVGEQVAAAIGKGWLDGVFADLESTGYACEAFVLPACAVNAPHRRDRIWFAAARGALGDCLRPGLEGHAGNVDGWPRWASADRPVAEAGGGSVVADGSRELLDGSGNAGTGRWNEFADGRGASRNVADASGERRQQVAGSAHGDEGAHEGRSAQVHHVVASDGESASGDVADGASDGRQQGQPAAASARHGGVVATTCDSSSGIDALANSLCERRERRQGSAQGDVSNGADAGRNEGHGRVARSSEAGGFWRDPDWIIGHDGKARRIPAIPQSALRGLADGPAASVDGSRAGSNAEEIESQVITLLAAGVPARVGKLKALGNGIVPELAAEFIGALMECRP